MHHRVTRSTLLILALTAGHLTVAHAHSASRASCNATAASSELRASVMARERTCAATPRRALPAGRATRAAAERAARRAAARYTKRTFGIHYRADAWDVDCQRRPKRRWWCGVTSEGGQCFGNLTLRERRDGRLTPTRHKIGCLE